MDAVAAALAAALESAAGPAADGRLFIGFSGGLDSTVLLHAASVLRPAAVTAVHVNHALHPDADLWQDEARRTAAACGARFVAQRVAVAASGSLEAAARHARYEVFDTLLERPADRLLLAHHRDDQAETVLLRLLQGRGVYGMPVHRRLGAGMLLRPLLALPRAALHEYARRHRLRWLEDPANTDLRMARNHLRHRVLPALRKRYAAIDQVLLDLLAQQRRYDDLLAQEQEGAADPGSIPLTELGSAAQLAEDRLRVWIARHRIELPTRAALQTFLAQARTAAPDRAPQLALQGATLRRFRDSIHLVRPTPALQPCYPVEVPGALALPHGNLRIEHAADGFRPVGAVTVRFRRGGEQLASGGHSRTVKAMLQAAALPPWQRQALPLLYDQQGLLAVPGLAVRDEARVAGGFRAVWRPAPADDGNG